MLIGTHNGYSVTFKEDSVRSMGRSATGVRGIRLRDDDYVVGADVLTPDSEVFVVSEKGYGKRTAASEYPIKGRGGKGIKTANVTEKNGPLAIVTTVNGDEDIMAVTDAGVMIRFNIDTVSQTGRATLGVRLMRVDAGTKVVTVAKLAEEIEPDDPDTPTAQADGATTGEVQAAPTEAPAGDADAQVNELLNRAEADQTDDSDDQA
jgi:DNA gyrase subunit A